MCVPRSSQDPFPALHPRTGKGQSVPVGELGYSGLCDGPAERCRGALAHFAPFKAGKETLLPPGSPQALDKGYSAHSAGEETEVLKVSQDAQGCRAKGRPEARLPITMAPS